MGFFLQAVLLLIDAGQKIGHFCVRAPIVITGPFIKNLLVTRHKNLFFFRTKYCYNNIVIFKCF